MMKMSSVLSFAASIVAITLAMLLLGIDLIGEFGWMKLVALLLLAGGFTAYVCNGRYHTLPDVAKVVETLDKEQASTNIEDWHGEGV